MKQLTAFVVLFLGFASAAPAAEDGGLYLGAGAGQFSMKADDIDSGGSITGDFSADDTSFKIFGGWRFNKYLGAELDYIDLGRPNEDVNGVDVKAKINGVAPYLTGTWPIGPIELGAKVGYLFYDLNVDVAGEEVGEVSGNQDDFLYSVGIGMTLFEHLHALLEYEVIDMSGAVNDADAVWLTGAWRF